MSNVSNVHAVVPFVSGKSVALTGQRLAKVGYKTTDKNPAKYPSVCASIPQIDSDAVTETLPRLMDHIKEYLESVQDKIFKNVYEANKGQMTNLTDEDISVEACIAYLEAESNGKRMTKESVEQWFGQYLEENLTVAIAEKLGCQNEEDIKNKNVQGIVNGYKGMLSALSGGATMYAKDKVDSLIRALEFSAAEDNTGIADKLRNRLNGMNKESNAVLVNL
jgi:hypothetical protein